MRKTIQRKIIMDIAQKMHNHPTAEEIYQAVRQAHPTISKATVYRNLNQLAEDGEIRSVLLPGSARRFDNHLPPHYHFTCRICDGIFDVDMRHLVSVNDAIQQMSDFHVEDHDVIFKGVCLACRQE